MRFFTYALVLLGLLTCIGVLYFRHETQAAEQAIRAEQQSAPEPQAAPAHSSSPSASANAAPSGAMTRLVETEARRLRRPTLEPEQESLRIRATATALTANDCAGLAVLVGHLSVHPDQRFAAAYLLTQASSADAVSALARIALSPIPSGTPSQTRFEKILRSLALERLSEARDSPEAGEALLRLAQMDSPVRARAQQALGAFLGRKPSVFEQDKTMLTDLIARSSALE